MIEILCGLFISAQVAMVKIPQPQPQLISGYATAYCDHGITASGDYTRDGICAMKKDYIGKCAVVYQRLPDDSVGEIIGIYEIKDTGGAKAIKEGKTVDVWKPDLNSCQDFMDRVYEDNCQGHVYIQLMEVKG